MKETLAEYPFLETRLKDSAPLYTGAGTEYVLLGSISDDHDLEIIEERWEKDRDYGEG